MSGGEVVATPFYGRQGHGAQDVKIAAGGCVSPKKKTARENAPALDPGHEGQTMLRFYPDAKGPACFLADWLRCHSASSKLLRAYEVRYWVTIQRINNKMKSLPRPSLPIDRFDCSFLTE